MNNNNKNNFTNIGLLNFPSYIQNNINTIDYKTLLQINKSCKLSSYFIKSLKNNKIQVYNGLKPALIRQFIYNTSRIILYENFKNNKYVNNKNNKTSTNTFILGGITSAISQFIASPFDLFKVHYINMKKTNTTISMFNIINNTINKTGIYGLWKGASPNISRSILISLCEFTTYDYLKTHIEKHIEKHIENKINLNNSLILSVCSCISSSICSSFISAIVCTPVDVVKSKLMKYNSPYNSAYDCLIQIIKKNGYLVLYKGFVSTWSRLLPTQIIFWFTYEQYNIKNI